MIYFLALIALIIISATAVIILGRERRVLVESEKNNLKLEALEIEIVE
jgi:cell division protein FtsL